MGYQWTWCEQRRHCIFLIWFRLSHSWGIPWEKKVAAPVDGTWRADLHPGCSLDQLPHHLKPRRPQDKTRRRLFPKIPSKCTLAPSWFWLGNVSILKSVMVPWAKGYSDCLNQFGHISRTHSGVSLTKNTGAGFSKEISWNIPRNRGIDVSWQWILGKQRGWEGVPAIDKQKESVKWAW